MINAVRREDRRRQRQKLPVCEAHKARLRAERGLGVKKAKTLRIGSRE
jgi:hypothetical protein